MNLERVIAVRNTKTVYKDSDRCVKVFDDSYLKSSILSEALNLTRIEETGIQVPELIEVTEIENKWTMVTKYIHGKTLARLMEEYPEKKNKFLSRFVDIQLDIQNHTCAQLPQLKDEIRFKIGQADIDSSVHWKLQAQLAGMPAQNRICHGDFEPSNIIITPDKQAYILDWENVTQGDGTADAAKTYLSFWMAGDLSAATAYLNLFCEKSKTDIQEINKWLPLVAAAQSVEVNKERRDILLSWIN